MSTTRSARRVFLARTVASKRARTDGSAAAAGSASASFANSSCSATTSRRTSAGMKPSAACATRSGRLAQISQLVVGHRSHFNTVRAAATIGRMSSAPIFGFNDSKQEIVREVVDRVTTSAPDPIFVLNEAAYLEMRRLAAKDGPEYAEWRGLATSLGRCTQAEARDKLRGLCERYAWDVAGNFNPSVYKFATKAMVPLLGTLLSPRSALRNIPQLGALHALDGRVVVQGPTETIDALSRIGTLIFTPTHLSNLDSVVFGFALERAGLPPATYGAGKNLFTNPVLSFFMHNLGAYRVDRRLKHALYKDVLKTYSCVLIERGYHSLFFPGGTRSRSGGVERRLKLGLAGSAMEAYARTLLAGPGKERRIFFVPAT